MKETVYEKILNIMYHLIVCLIFVVQKWVLFRIVYCIVEKKKQKTTQCLFKKIFESIKITV